jgi:hypothetical protein
MLDVGPDGGTDLQIIEELVKNKGELMHCKDHFVNWQRDL